ncbi:MAG TPA: NfeD family protein [Thermoanaerobaculia bacterium]|nr:NfeD family protein [Thermoanaerobaculia bacterium]
MIWWIWVLAGFVLLALELLTAGVHLGLFGAAAIVVGLLVVAGIGGPLWLQLLLFSIFSVLLLVVARPPLMRKLRGSDVSDQVDSLVGQTAVVSAAIEPHGLGRAELRGTGWSARNLGEASLSPGQRCKVEAVEGLTLMIRA